MGTNFYWYADIPLRTSVVLPTGDEYCLNWDRDDPIIHIGKRSAAGPYCYDCDLTLCQEGILAIHRSNSFFYKKCPKCKKELIKEDLKNSSSGVELGFGKARSVRPTGVHSCCSFSWAQDPDRVRKICLSRQLDIIVSDEYGGTFTGREFLDMLAGQCPIEYSHSIGTRFS